MLTAKLGLADSHELPHVAAGIKSPVPYPPINVFTILIAFCSCGESPAQRMARWEYAGKLWQLLGEKGTHFGD
jgi:hypothetical protein